MNDPAGGNAQWPSPARAWYGLVVLTIGLLVATVDRGVISLLIDPIKRDLAINDIDASLLIGGAFVAAYMWLGVPISFLADTRSRRVIIAVGMAFWSVMTCLCGFAQTYQQIFWARVGVGAGESAFAPATYSIITDSFPPKDLARAIAVMSMGFTSGLALSSLVGGAVIKGLSALPHVALPVIGNVHLWQAVFILIGLPGLLAAALMLTIEEPKRRGRLVPTESGARPKRLPVRIALKFMYAERATYLPMFIGLGIKTLLGFGTGLWLPAFVTRTYHWQIPETAFALGIIAFATGIAGLLAGGWLTELYARRGFDDANIRVLLIATILVLPTSVAFPLMPTATGALVVIGFNTFFASLGIGPANAALQVVTPNEMRGLVRALYQFVFNVVGYFLGPLFVAFFTVAVFKDEGAIRFSLVAAAAITGPLAIWVTWWGLKPYVASFTRARARIG
jgi:MFS family permease